MKAQGINIMTHKQPTIEPCSREARGLPDDCHISKASKTTRSPETTIPNRLILPVQPIQLTQKKKKNNNNNKLKQGKTGGKGRGKGKGQGDNQGKPSDSKTKLKPRTAEGKAICESAREKRDGKQKDENGYCTYCCFGPTHHGRDCAYLSEKPTARWNWSSRLWSPAEALKDGQANIALSSVVGTATSTSSRKKDWLIDSGSNKTISTPSRTTNPLPPMRAEATQATASCPRGMGYFDQGQFGERSGILSCQ